MTRGSLGLLAGFAVALTVSCRVEAQGSAGGQKPPDQATQNELTENLGLSRDLEITEALLEDFGTGLNTELRLLGEFVNVLAGYKSWEEYQACSQKVSRSPESLKLMNALLNIPDGAPPDAMVNAMYKLMADPKALERYSEKLEAETNALVRRKCGANINEDWPASKRQERLVEIEAAGEAAFDAARAARAAPARGPSAGDAPWTEGPAPSELYYVLKDKIFSFCEAWKQRWIIIDDKDGQFKFSFSTAMPLSLLYTQAEARAQHAFCTNAVNLAALFQAKANVANADFKRLPTPPDIRRP